MALLPPPLPKWCCPQCRREIPDPEQRLHILVLQHDGFGILYCRDCGILFSVVDIAQLDRHLKTLPKRKRLKRRK